MNDSYAILDIRGLALHSLHMGEDPNGQLHPETGKLENSAHYGFSNFFDHYLKPILEAYSPRQIIAVHEGGNQYRRGFFPGYKYKRSQIEYSEFAAAQHEQLMTDVKRLLAYIGCTQCKVDKAEADDTMAYLCDKLPGRKIVYTRDKDMAQLLKDDRVEVMYMGEMLERTYRHQYCNVVQSLLGDTSDEYPGISGFGEKKLDAILNEFGEDTLYDLAVALHSRVYTDIEDAASTASDPQAVKGFELILGNLKDWELMYHLACLHPEICEGGDKGKFREIEWYKRVPDSDKVATLMSSYDMAAEYEQLEPILPAFKLVTKANLAEFDKHLNEHMPVTPFFSFDFESYDVLKHADFNKAKKSKGDYVDVLSQSITGMSINYGDSLQYTAYLSCDHADTDNMEDTVLESILRACRLTHKPMIAHNAPFEYALCDTNFLWDAGELEDTAIMARYVDENETSSLKDLSKRWLNYDQENYANVLARCEAQDMSEVSGVQVLHYGCDDSQVTACLRDLFYLILQIEGTWEFVKENEFATNIALYEAFETGIRLDRDRMAVLEKEDGEMLELGTQRCRELLALHCNVPEPERAKELFNDLSTFEEAKLLADGKDREQINIKLEQLKNRLEESTQYLPLVTYKKEVKFTPTPKQITKLGQSLGITAELTGVTPNKVTEYVSEIDYDEIRPTLTELQNRFLELLAGTGKELRKREGEAFEEFNQFCIDQLSGDAGEITEGDELNMDSPKQMQQLFYCKLGLPIRVRSKVQSGSKRDELGFEGSPGTDDKAIDFALAQDARGDDWRREFLTTWKEIKGCHTRFKNYWRPYPLWIHPRDNFLHGGIKNAATTTHRFTGGDPNLLAIPSKDGGRVRSIVLPNKDDHVILSPDLNGEELRITASLSKDPVMIDAYMGENPRDIHTLTASSISGTVINRESPELAEALQFQDVSGLPSLSYAMFDSLLEDQDKDVATLAKNIRKLAKGVNFLLIYVGGPSTLARNVGVPVEVAEAFLQATLATYPRLQPWQQESIEYARKHGYVLTSYGNRRHLGDGLFDTDNYTRTRLERQAVNAQVQGTGSDIMKIVCKRLLECNFHKTYGASGIVFPYDELAFSVPRAAAWESWLAMKDAMSINPPGHAVPQLPELKASALNWGTCVELGAEPTEDELNEVFDRQLSERRAA
jgi:DNA polymerase I-like protein with 3'-5' exonuclease and polymerase domains/5'-3' exonuclease